MILRNTRETFIALFLNKVYCSFWKKCKQTNCCSVSLSLLRAENFRIEQPLFPRLLNLDIHCGHFGFLLNPRIFPLFGDPCRILTNERFKLRMNIFYIHVNKLQYTLFTNKFMDLIYFLIDLEFIDKKFQLMGEGISSITKMLNYF